MNISLRFEGITIQVLPVGIFKIRINRAAELATIVLLSVATKTMFSVFRVTFPIATRCR